MTTPFQVADRAELTGAILPVFYIGLHAYELPSLVNAAAGALQLANGINDNTRAVLPTSYNAVFVYASANSEDALSKKLESINTTCPLPIFLQADSYANALKELEQTKTTLPGEKAQSLSWQQMDNVSIPSLSAAYNDSSLTFVSDECTDLITNIDDALTELADLKEARNTNLTETSFEFEKGGVAAVYISAVNAEELANKITQTIGESNNNHWVYCCYVGDEQALQPIKDLLL
jgi:hypothetical protein